MEHGWLVRDEDSILHGSSGHHGEQWLGHLVGSHVSFAGKYGDQQGVEEIAWVFALECGVSSVSLKMAISIRYEERRLTSISHFEERTHAVELKSRVDDRRPTVEWNSRWRMVACADRPATCAGVQGKVVGVVKNEGATSPPVVEPCSHGGEVKALSCITTPIRRTASPSIVQHCALGRAGDWSPEHDHHMRCIVPSMRCSRPRRVDSEFARHPMMQSVSLDADEDLDTYPSLMSFDVVDGHVAAMHKSGVWLACTLGICSSFCTSGLLIGGLGFKWGQKSELFAKCLSNSLLGGIVVLVLSQKLGCNGLGGPDREPVVMTLWFSIFGPDCGPSHSILTGVILGFVLVEGFKVKLVDSLLTTCYSWIFLAQLSLLRREFVCRGGTSLDTG